MLFTGNPYKVIPFNSLIQPKIGGPVGIPDTLNAILIEEKGGAIIYPLLPKSYNNILTEEIVNQYTQYRTGTLYHEPTRYLYSIDSGYMIGFLGLIYDKSRRSFIDESAKLWMENLQTSNYINYYNPSAAEYLPGVTLSCITAGADGGFYHFFHEVLPKLFFCRDILPRTDHILMNGPADEWKTKWLTYIGIDLDKVIWINNKSHYKCNQLLFTNRLIGNYHISNWSLSAIKSLLKISPLPPTANTGEPNIIWITRKTARTRTVAWERELLAQFPSIKSIDTSELSATDTIKVFENATHVISPHGAGLSNIMMCRPKTKVLELFADIKNYQPCYFRISSLCGLEHFVAETDFNTKSGMQDCSIFLTDFLTPVEA
jgi:capsular polysaccharide biosynthesis protein